MGKGIQVILQNPCFYFGIIAGWFSALLFYVYKKNKKEKKQRGMIIYSSVIDRLLELRRQGVAFSLEEEFPCDLKAKKKETPRSQAWKCFAYWMAHKYAQFEYSFETKDEILDLAAYCFGEGSMSYSKLCAVEELLNRSTKYYLGEKQGFYDLKPIEHSEPLYDMVDLVINSMYAENY